jgi:carboxypeptidase C (cathepsin A)
MRANMPMVASTPWALAWNAAPIGYFDLATPYFASKYILERLELDEVIFPNLRLSLYPGGHMFYTRADAREHLYRDAKALYEMSTQTPAH